MRVSWEPPRKAYRGQNGYLTGAVIPAAPSRWAFKRALARPLDDRSEPLRGWQAPGHLQRRLSAL